MLDVLRILKLDTQEKGMHIIHRFLFKLIFL